MSKQLTVNVVMEITEKDSYRDNPVTTVKSTRQFTGGLAEAKTTLRTVVGENLVTALQDIGTQELREVEAKDDE